MVTRRSGTCTTRRLLPSLGVLCALTIVPACGSSPPAPAAVATSSTSATPSTTSAVTLPDQNPAELAACVADVQSVMAALQASMAERSTFPAPAAPWSAATYVANYAPLTAGTDGGPFLHSAPSTLYYVIEYDASGQVWVAPPGSYGPYDKGQDFAIQPNICDAAVG
jgi:hypothetical protein